MDHLNSEDGAAALVNLETEFRKMDTDGNEVLSLNEFKAGLVSYGIEIGDDDLRELFFSLDTNGDGSLSIDEFIALLRPELPNSRKQYIRNAFIKLDRFNARKVAMDDLFDVFLPEFHVDVLAGVKTAREVVTEMANAFMVDNSEGMVSYDKFYNYYSSLSAFIESDDDFIVMMKNCWGIGEKAPAPFVGVQVAGRGLNNTNSVTPADRQCYGNIIAWNQEESVHESKTRKHQRDTSLLAKMHQRDSDVIRWNKMGEGSTASVPEFSSRRQELLAAANKSDLHAAPPVAITRTPVDPQATALGEPQAAGSNTRDRHKLRDGNNVRHESKHSVMMRRNFGGPTPFGVSYEVSFFFPFFCNTQCVFFSSHPFLRPLFILSAHRLHQKFIRPKSAGQNRASRVLVA
jgi:Ca2+-binding EF-hand superfamily protein